MVRSKLFPQQNVRARNLTYQESRFVLAIIFCQLCAQNCALMKYFCTLLATLLLYHVGGQTPVWNKELPLSISTNASQISLQANGSEYLISGQKNIIALNHMGEITGAVLTNFVPATYGFGSFIRPKIDITTGEKYFLLATSKLSGSNAMIIDEYRAGIGFVHETILDDAISSSAFSPAFLELSDSTYVILGRKYLRQITHRPGQGVVVNWEKPSTFGNSNAGVRTSNGIVGVSHEGVVFALDATGNTLWADTTDYVLRDIQLVNNGFLAVGRNVDSLAVLIKFSPTGVTEWTKTYDDLVYNKLLLEADGSLTVTGQSDSLQVALHHLAADGTSIWRKTYQPGAGRTLLRLDDGYVVAGQASNYAFVLRTDAGGNTSLMEPRLNPRKRRVQNTLLQAVASPSATLFFDVEPNFWVPKDSVTTLFYAAAPWLGAIDQDSLLHLSAALYGNDSLSDFRSGISMNASNDLDRVWWVSRAQIEYLRQDWADNGILDHPVPYDISTWPAKGNAGFTYNLDFTKTTTDKSLLPAPFVDANSDGLYSPTDGDYPHIKGDQMAWWTITDSTLHTITDGKSLVADMSISIYAYDCAEDIQLGQSLFVDYEIINRSENAYDQVFAGIWADPDLGCAYDDYIGTLMASNALYVYNQDDVDGQSNSACLGATFKNNIPVGSLSFVNATLHKSIFFQSGSILPFPNNSLPYENGSLYQLLRGLTPNGQPIDHFFPGNPADPASNSMCKDGNIPAGDYRALGSHGPFSLSPNDTFRLTLAFTYHPNIPLPCPDIFGTVKNDLDQLHTLVNSGALEAPSQLPSTVQIAPGQSVLLNATVPGATAYAWSNGATTAATSITLPGQYSVTITRITGCTTMETVLITAATATDEATWLDHVRIFPNPTAGPFHLEVRGAAHEVLELTLFNALGQAVQQQVVDFGSGVLNQMVDCPHLPTGIYSLRLRAGEKTRHVKVILQR